MTVSLPAAQSARWPQAMLAGVLVLQVTLVLHRFINWDEFWHYSLVNKLAAGTLVDPLQTLFTRAFTWVLALPGSGIDHIVVIRGCMLACELVTLGAIVCIARRFASPAAAWLCALAYLGGGYVFQHGTSFRFDPPATAALMCAAALLLRAPLRPAAILATGALLGLAGMLTIKAVLYAPVFAGIAWLRWSEQGRAPAALLRLIAVALVAAASFAVIYWLHASALPAGSAAAAQRVAGTARDQMFALGLQPYWRHHLHGITLAPVQALLAAAVPFALANRARPLAERLAVLGLWLPLTTLLFYRNTAPYYFVFMLAPVSAACAWPIEAALRRYSARGLAIVLALFTLAVWLMEPRGVMAGQRQVVATAELLFPRGVAYFDGPAMLGRFPKANAFLSPWGTAQYLSGLLPDMASAARAQPVPLVLDDDQLIHDALQTRRPMREFLPQDLALLRGSYVPFWGPLWLAGFDLAPGAEQQIMVAVPGPYTLQAAAPLAIDGTVHQPGAVIALERGPHRIGPRQGAVRLLWGERLSPPREMPPPDSHDQVF